MKVDLLARSFWPHKVLLLATLPTTVASVVWSMMAMVVMVLLVLLLMKTNTLQ